MAIDVDTTQLPSPMDRIAAGIASNKVGRGATQEREWPLGDEWAAFLTRAGRMGAAAGAVKGVGVDEGVCGGCFGVAEGENRRAAQVRYSPDTRPHRGQV